MVICVGGLMFRCNCKGEPGSDKCYEEVGEDRSLCKGCMTGKHPHTFYQHFGIRGGCVGKGCQICKIKIDGMEEW